MKTQTLLLIIAFLFLLTVVYFMLVVPQRTRPKELKFENGTVKTSFSAIADSSVDIELLKSSYAKHHQRWDLAFKYLSELNVNNSLPSRSDLSADVFALGSEYETKEHQEGKYESHRKFADIQHVASGSELIGFTRKEDLEILSPYNEEKDVVFYRFDGGEMRKANQKNFFIFFPHDIHKPSLINGKKEKVKKVVVKVKLD